jgi:hypothetical protein
MGTVQQRWGVVLLALLLLVGGGNLWATYAQVHDYKAEQAREQAVQARQGAHVLHLLCASFGELASDTPPAGNPAQNPSRAFDQKQHVILVSLGTDLGCGRK